MELDSHAKRELVTRVAGADRFRKAPRLRELLLYVAECTLANRFEDAREQQIARKVFKRTPDYLPRQDNIVRVEARSLRKRLESHFLQDGKDEPIIIVMPKGGYTLRFEPRTKVDNVAFKESKSETLFAVAPRRRILLATAAVLVLALLLLVIQRTLH
jgi:hypothetical protein